jgi:alcohol dehydrogenase (cytochrome c)
VIDSVIYSITAGSRVAPGWQDRKELWNFQPKLDPLTQEKVLFSPYSRGVAVGHGMVFIGTVDGRGMPSTEDRQRKMAGPVDRFRRYHGCNFTSPPVVAGDYAGLRIDRWRDWQLRENLRGQPHRQEGLGIQHHQG